VEGEHVNWENSLSRVVDFTLFPKPVQQPAPPIYVGGLRSAVISRVSTV